MKRLTIFFLVVASLCNAQNSIPPNFNYSQNLLINGDAEIDALNRNVYAWKPFPKTTSSDFLQDAYGEQPGEWEANCNEKCGLPPNAGKNYFRLPIDDSYKNFALYQTVDLSGFKDTLVVKEISFDLDAFIAGFTCTENGCARGILSIVFKDASGNETGSFEVKKDNSEFSNIGDNDAMRRFEKINISDLIPVKTTSAEIWLKAKGDCCNSANVFFDNVSFILSKGEKRKQ